MNTIKSNARRVSCVSASLLALCMLGCSHQSDLVGTWRGAALVSSGLGNAAVTYEFGADGIEQMSAKIPPQNPATAGAPMMAMLGMGGITNIHTGGTYIVKGDVLSVTTTQFTMQNAHDQPFPMTSSTHAQPRTLRFHVRGNPLTLDDLDGPPPAVLTRQKA